MISLFSRAMDNHVDAQFREDATGRLVFLPFGPRKTSYFVDSKSDEEKIRSFVKMYRSAFALINLLVFPTIYLPGVVLNFCRMPLRSKLETVGVTSSFFVLLLGASMFTLWSVYKETIPRLTSSLSEVGPAIASQLAQVSPAARRLQRVALWFLIAGAALLITVAWAAWLHFRN